jgi:N-methylhydantoinase A
MPEFYVASDIGGTFTDTVIADSTGQVYRYKVSTTPEDPVLGVLETLEIAAAARNMPLKSLLEKVRIFSHGTTIATNALLERKGCRTGLIQSKGFGDTLYIMRGYKSIGLEESQMKNFRLLTKPTPVIERSLIREVSERIDYKGRVIMPLDEEQARLAVRGLINDGVESIAVSLLWSFKFPGHEQRIREIIREEDPNIYVTLSSEIMARLGEYARSVTASINSYLAPMVSKAMESLDKQMRDNGLKRSPLLMQSNGGLISAKRAANESVAMLLSGPVGGVVGAGIIGKQIGSENVVSADMGGTSFDVGLVVGGRPVIERETYMDRQPIAIPSVSVDTIGAGGGSIASVKNGVLSVGPRSAGAVPGPVSYGKGGTEPTVTDADIVLGIINPENFLGGRIKLNREKAAEAIRIHVADPLGISVEQAAEGIKSIIDSRMADLVRQSTVYKGYDPREFALVAFGGAGPMHAYSYGAELGVSKIVIPVAASVLSAYGILSSDLLVTRELSKSLISPPGTDQFSEYISAVEINEIFTPVQEEAAQLLIDQGVELKDITFERYVDVRFRPQIYDLSIEAQSVPFEKEDVDRLVETFIETYEARFGAGSAFRSAGIEISAFRVIAKAELSRPSLSSMRNDGQVVEVRPVGSRKVFQNGEWIDTSIYDERAVHPGASFAGPAIIELPDTTLVIGCDQSASVDSFLNVIIRLNKEES